GGIALGALGDEEDTVNGFVNAVVELDALDRVVGPLFAEGWDNLRRIGAFGQVAEALEERLADFFAFGVPFLQVGRDRPIGDAEFLVLGRDLGPRYAEAFAAFRGLRLDAFLGGERRGDEEKQRDGDWSHE